MYGTLIFGLAYLLVTEGNGVPIAKDKSDDADDSLGFLVLADWGGMDYHPFRTRVQVAVANEMAATAERENASFVLALGDNIYLDGVRSVHDSRFRTTFEETYHHDSLHIPWYVVAGNHDYYRSVSAQIQYSLVSDRWTFPNYYYKLRKYIPGGKTLDILMLDTLVLCGQIQLTGDGHHKVGGYISFYPAAQQWMWLKENLRDSDADYLLVAGHYPVRSVGFNGPTECLVQQLEPLLYRYHVTAYLSGHDHNLQHIQMTKGHQQMNYFISGSGAYVDPDKTNTPTVPENSLKFFLGEEFEVGGFAFIDVTSSRMKLQFIDTSGTVRYEYEMKPRDK